MSPRGPTRSRCWTELNWCCSERFVGYILLWITCSYLEVNHLLICCTDSLAGISHWTTCGYVEVSYLWVCWSEAHVGTLKWATCGCLDVSHLWVSSSEPHAGMLKWAICGYVEVSHMWVCCSDHWSASLCNWQDVKIQQPTTNWLLSTLKWVSCWCCCCCDHLSAGCREPLVVYYSDHLLSCCSDLLFELLECCLEPLVGML